MLDHIVIGVSDITAAKRFYEGALAPLGFRTILELPGRIGLGRDGKPSFFLRAGGGHEPVHVAFTAPDHQTVDAFHEAALAAGGRDNGPPGLRPMYHPNYYGAFSLDPDGHNVEAVCHTAQ